MKKLKHEVAKTRRRKVGEAISSIILSSLPPAFLLSLCALVPLWFTLFLSCTTPQRTTMTVMPASETNRKFEKVYAPTEKDKILAEKDGAILVYVNGLTFWTPVNKDAIPKKPATNQYGFCESAMKVNESVPVYLLPDIASPVIDNIAANQALQVVEFANYFAKINTTRISTNGFSVCGWVYMKDLSNYSSVSYSSKPKAKFIENEKSMTIQTAEGSRTLIKGVTSNEAALSPAMWQKLLLPKSVQATKSGLIQYADTFENLPYAKQFVDAAGKRTLNYYERALVFYKNNDVVILSKQFAFLDTSDPKKSSFATGPFGDASYQPLSKVEFYNAYGEKTAEYFGEVVKVEPSSSGEVVYVHMSRLSSDENGASYSSDFGLYMTKYGKLIKNLARPSLTFEIEAYDQYYYVLDRVEQYGSEYRHYPEYVDVKVFDMVRNAMIMHIHYDKNPYKKYMVGRSSKESLPIVFYEYYGDEKGQDWYIGYDVNGKVIRTGKTSF